MDLQTGANLAEEDGLGGRDVSHFASETTLHSSLAYLQQTLASMGLCDATLDLTSTRTCDLVTTCNTIYGLLLQHQRDVQYKEQLKQEMVRARLELQTAEKERNKLDSKLQSKEREIGALSNAAKTGEDARKEEVGRARREAEELQRRMLGTERRLVQMQHEMKRKEREFERLQEKLSNYLMDKKKSETAALDVAGQLLVAHGPQTAASRSVIRSDEGIRAVVSAYEGKQSELLRENKDLKAALASLQTEYKGALNASKAQRDLDAAAAPVLGETFLRAVPHMSADELRAELASKLKVLHRRLGNMGWQDKPNTASSVSEQRINADLSIARSVIRDQEQLILSVLSALRAAQVAQDTKFQADVKALTQRYQAQVAAAEENILQTRATAQRDLDIQREELGEVAARLIKERDEALTHLQKSDTALKESELRMHHNVAEVHRTADIRIADAVAAIQAKAEVDMTRIAAESTEFQLTLKREQAALRVETGALRERLIAEKAASAKAIAQLKEAMVQLEHAEETRAAFASMQDQLHASERQAAALQIQSSDTIALIQKEYAEKLDNASNHAMRERDLAVAAIEAEKASLMAELAAAQDTVARIRIRHEADMASLEERMSFESAKALEGETELRRSMAVAHEAEIVALTQTVQKDRAAVLIKAEKDFNLEREMLEEEKKQLEMALKSEKNALQAKEEILRTAETKGRVAEQTIEQYSEMTRHYKELMKQYAPGIGAGVFLERAVHRKAGEVVAGKALM